MRRRDDHDAVVQSDGLDDEAEMKNKKTESDAAVNPATASPRTPGPSGSPHLLQRNSPEHPGHVAAAGSNSPGALLWRVHDDCPHALAVLAPAPYGRNNPSLAFQHRKFVDLMPQLSNLIGE